MRENPQEIVVQADDLRKFASEIYQSLGVPKEDANALADMEVRTDLRGVYSHGTRLAPRYVKGLKSGTIKALPDIQVIKESASVVVLDGDTGLGYLAAEKAMSLAISKAKETGFAAAGVRNSDHYGAAGLYSMMALEHGMIGFATTNTGHATVAAPTSISPMTANNPLSYAIPAKDELPIVLDMACAISAWGRVDVMDMYGQDIPEGWLMTKDGEPTCDPSIGKTMFHAGGVKGFGLAAVMGTLAGPLVGGLTACLKGDDPPSEHFFYALDINSFTSLEEFTETMDRTIRKIHESKAAEGVDRVYLPGEIEWLNQQKFQKDGIPLHRDHLGALAVEAKKLGIDVFWE